VSRKGAIDKLKILGRASNIEPGPLLITGVGGKKYVCDHGVYSVSLPLHNGKEVEMQGLCMDVVTSEFPTYQLKDVENPRQSTRLRRAPSGKPRTLETSFRR
jgi:hypothetical protein